MWNLEDYSKLFKKSVFFFIFAIFVYEYTTNQYFVDLIEIEDILNTLDYKKWSNIKDNFTCKN